MSHDDFIPKKSYEECLQDALSAVALELVTHNSKLE